MSNRAVGLAPEIISQIRDSVNNSATDGRPIVIECENTNTNSEIGRVIGEAVTQTFQNLSNQVTGNAGGSEEAPRPADEQVEEETVTTSVTTTTTTRNDPDGAEPVMTHERTEENTRSVNGRTIQHNTVLSKLLNSCRECWRGLGSLIFDPFQQSSRP